MSTYLIINLADIQERQAVSMQMPDSELNPHIVSAQRFGLRSLVGEPMYLDLLAQLSGGTPDAATTALLPYVKDYLCYEVSYNLFNLSQAKITAGGVVRKTSTLSEPLSDTAINKMSGTLKSYSTAAADMLLTFICENAANYPLYGGKGKATVQTVPGFGTFFNDNPNN